MNRISQFYNVLRAVQSDPGVAEHFLMAHGAPLDLVILRRDPVPMATSLYL